MSYCSGSGFLYAGDELKTSYKLKATACQFSLTGVKGQADAAAGGTRDGEKGWNFSPIWHGGNI